MRVYRVNKLSNLINSIMSAQQRTRGDFVLIRSRTRWREPSVRGLHAVKSSNDIDFRRGAVHQFTLTHLIMSFFRFGAERRPRRRWARRKTLPLRLRRIRFNRFPLNRESINRFDDNWAKTLVQLRFICKSAHVRRIREA